VGWIEDDIFTNVYSSLPCNFDGSKNSKLDSTKDY